MTRLELILRLATEWRNLRKKYPEDDRIRSSWRTLAVGYAIAALIEEECRVDSWRELMPTKHRGTKSNVKQQIKH